MTLILLPEELVSLLFNLLESFITSVESFFVLRTMVLNRMIGPLSNITRLCLLQVKLVDSVLTESVLTILIHLRILIVVQTLCLELTVALVLDFVKRASMEVRLLLNVLLDRKQSLFCLISRLDKLFLSFLLLAFGHLHALLQVDVTLFGPL